jgi:type VI secretion system secreted protein Hcp
MASNAYLKLTGQKQGLIKGGVTQKGREGQIQVTSWTWEGDRDGGVASASEFSITKHRDVSTPKLLNAFSNNELMTNWELLLWDVQPGTGTEVQSTTFELLGARLASFRQSGVDTGATDAPDHDELTFTFTRIDVTWEDGGIQGTFEP